MEKICAVVDAQGFYINNKFFVRELSMVSDELTICIEFDPGFNWHELSQEDKNIIMYSTKYIHGLYFRPFNPDKHNYLNKSEDIGFVLQKWYQMVATNQKYLFAHKNNQLGKILTELGIQCIDLSELNFPTYDKIQQKYGDVYLCAYHKRPRSFTKCNLTCAYRKACHLYRELKENCQ
jgi:hypothetical protein